MQVLVCSHVIQSKPLHWKLEDGFNMRPDILTIAVKIAFMTTNDPFSFTLDDLKV